MALDTKLKSECEQFIDGFGSLLLSTLNPDGSPDLSYTPFVDYEGQFLILTSHLSAHTGNLINDSRATVLFIEDESRCELQLQLIDGLRSSFGSDYGVHYLLASCAGLLQLHERSDLVRDALSEIAPQYAKSRVAAAWSCVRLGLKDQRSALQELSQTNRWQPLRWSCERVLVHLA